MAFACTCARCRRQFILPLPVGSAHWICAECKEKPSPDVAPSSQFDLGKAAMWTLAAVGTYKFVVQPLLDQEYAGRTLPRGVRDRLKAEHIENHGSNCPSCGLRTSWASLVIDHIVPYAKGGRTSVQNSQVLCLWCNLDKRDKANVLDHLRGRGGRW